MIINKVNAIEQLDAVINLYNSSAFSIEAAAQPRVRALSTDASEWYSQVFSMALAAIDRIAGSRSVYAMQALKVSETQDYAGMKVGSLIGVIKALRRDVEAGFLTTMKELAHAELFSDFLDMADFLLAEGYKDAAAVMGGGVLESHLRQLCIKNSIDLDFTNSVGKPKRADTLNAELAKKNVYNILDQKSITAWLDLRNKAAHAKYGEYSKEQVMLMLQGIRNFVARFSA